MGTFKERQLKRLSTNMPSNVLVSGLSDNQYNGLYVYDGELNGKPSYRYNINFLFWNAADSFWTLEDGANYTLSYSNVDYPWLATNWIFDSIDPLGLVMTEVPVFSQPTFGLPADAVALITAHFGSVANFLRLRNQGQV